MRDYDEEDAGQFDALDAFAAFSALMLGCFALAVLALYILSPAIGWDF